MTSLHLTEETIIARLANRPLLPPVNPYPSVLFNGKPEHAAVLVPCFQNGRNWHIVFIRRTVMQTDRHSGQVAFPGGRSDSGDLTPETTALREANEELGIRPQETRILGRLEDFITITNYRVTPVVARIPFPYEFTPCSEEVSRVFSIPLEWLAVPSHRQTLTQQISAEHAPISVIYFEPYDGEVLWGASARITVGLLSALQLNG